MATYNIGSRREVCWDEYLMDSCEGIRVQMHQPEFKEVIMEMDKGWEGQNCGYFTIIREGEVYRFYYRAANMEKVDEDGCNDYAHKSYYCVMETRDGRNFTRVPVNEIPFMGVKENNIIIEPTPENEMDNVFFFYDRNPECPADERYKALSGANGQKLAYYKSGDGIHFERARVLVDDGAYDSLNVCFWDSDTKQYYLYYRGMHGPSIVSGKWDFGDVSEERRAEIWKHGIGCIRDVRVRTSKDFVTWEPMQKLDYGPDAPDIELYTNNTMKYYRANHMFLAFPTRYVDRYEDAKQFHHLTDWKHRQQVMDKIEPRSGTALTDTAIMTSRDGVNFRRTEEAWWTAGYERGINWYYGDGYFNYGMIETKNELPGGPNEISMYCQTLGACELRRYTIRLDGFFSWRCDAKPGKVVTKPITFEGASMEVNFATSIYGYVRIKLMDADGNYIEGYDSGRMFGNRVDRIVEFDADLAALSGKDVRMEISMFDADLYSFRVNKVPRF